MSEIEQLPAGCAKHYVSVGVERNSRGINVDAKASAWYQAHPDESPESAAAKLIQAQAAAVSVVRLTVSAANEMVDGGASNEDVAAFIALVERFSGQILTQQDAPWSTPVTSATASPEETTP